MVEARQNDNWNHTAAIMTLTANCHRGEKTRTFKIEDFHPFMDRAAGVAITSDTIHLLKQFAGGKTIKP